MNQPVTALTRELDDGSIEILAPHIGIWSSQPKDRSLLAAGAGIGVLKCQNARYGLVLPDGIAGRVTDFAHNDRFAAVQYGQRLFTLAPIDAADNNQTEKQKTPTSQDLPEGCHAVTAPTDGVFYARPAPDAPPFVQVGDTIHLGHTIGLVEVMKTFNPILYGGPDLPDQAEVVEVRAGDGGEIRAGELLLVVRPAGP